MRFFIITFAILAALLPLIQAIPALKGESICFRNHKPDCFCPDKYDPVITTNGCRYSSPCIAGCFHAAIKEKLKNKV